MRPFEYPPLRWNSKNLLLPTHSLQILNATLRTDILRHLHGLIQNRRRHQGKKSPLIILIESIEDILDVFSDSRFFACVAPNPFNTEHFSFLFDPEQSYRHDIELLTFQLRSLREILAEIEENSSFFSGSSSIPLTEEHAITHNFIHEVLQRDGADVK